MNADLLFTYALNNFPVLRSRREDAKLIQTLLDEHKVPFEQLTELKIQVLNKVYSATCGIYMPQPITIIVIGLLALLGSFFNWNMDASSRLMLKCIIASTGIILIVVVVYRLTCPQGRAQLYRRKMLYRIYKGLDFCREERIKQQAHGLYLMMVNEANGTLGEKEELTLSAAKSFIPEIAALSKQIKAQHQFNNNTESEPGSK